MPQQIQVFVPSINGSGRFVFSFSKKNAIRLIIFTGFIILASSLVFAIFLNKQSLNTDEALNNMSQKSSELLNILEDLEQQRNYLDDMIIDKQEAFSQQLATNDVFMGELSQRMLNLEDILGIDTDPSGKENLFQRLDQAALIALVRATMMTQIPNGSPLKVATQTSGFGSRTHPVTGNEKFHLGLDLTAKVGTAIYSPADGVVEQVRSSKRKGYGNLLKIEHGYGFMTLYAHLDRFNVKIGQFVQKGELIGWTGNTGLSTGPHLHYEVRFVGRALNPINFMEWSIDDFNQLFNVEKRVNWTALVEQIENAMIPHLKFATDLNDNISKNPISFPKS